MTLQQRHQGWLSSFDLLMNIFLCVCARISVSNFWFWCHKPKVFSLQPLSASFLNQGSFYSRFYESSKLLIQWIIGSVLSCVYCVVMHLYYMLIFFFCCFSSPLFFPVYFSLSTKDIEARSDHLKLFETLKCNPEDFYSHMNKYVLPSIEGSDLGRLLYYHTLIDAAGCEPYVTTTIKPDSHIKLLKKLRAVANGKVYTVFFYFSGNGKSTT